MIDGSTDIADSSRFLKQKEVKLAEENTLAASQDALRRTEAVSKATEEAMAAAICRIEQAMNEAKLAEENNLNASRDALKKAEESMLAAQKASEAATASMEEVKSEKMIKRILSSRQFINFLLIIIIVAMVAAVGISLGLSLLAP